jgi:hypothetical protein
VNLGEFAEQIGAENREVLQFGAFFQWDKETRQEHNVPMGPANPQALNRYAYCLGNPLRYVDPTGREGISLGFELSPEEAAELMRMLDEVAKWNLIAGVGEIGVGLASEIFGTKFLSSEFFALMLGIPTTAACTVLAGGAIGVLLTWDDLNSVRIAMGDLQADSIGAQIGLNWGVFGSYLTVETQEGNRAVHLKNLSFVGSAAPQILAGTLMGFRARSWFLPRKHYMYMPLIMR